MRPVKIPAARFFDTDKLEYPVAHDLKLGQFVQGALLEKELRSESRVYIVIALIYLVITTLSIVLLARLEKRFSLGVKAVSL